MTGIRAQMSRLCCDAEHGTAGARWRLYVVVPGNVGEWPTVQWPVRSRHAVPTVEQRTQVLAELGFELVPDAEWSWCEAETPAYHQHPQRVQLLASVDVRPVARGGAS